MSLVYAVQGIDGEGPQHQHEEDAGRRGLGAEAVPGGGGECGELYL